MKFIESSYPVIVLLGDRLVDEAEIKALDENFRRYFTSGKRYAIITAQPPNKNFLDAKGRKLVADWANQPDVREFSRTLCVGTASVITSALARGVYTALMWIWTPATPVRPVSTVAEGIDYCFERLQAEGVPLSAPAEVLRRRITEAVGQT